MTSDVVALMRQPPTSEALARALLAAGPQLRIGTLADGAILQLFDAEWTLVASIDVAARIDIAGEAERLLGVNSPPTPYWWLEVHTPSASSGGRHIAEAFAASLVEQLDGSVWPQQLPDDRRRP